MWWFLLIFDESPQSLNKNFWNCCWKFILIEILWILIKISRVLEVLIKIFFFFSKNSLKCYIKSKNCDDLRCFLWNFIEILEFVNRNPLEFFYTQLECRNLHQYGKIKSLYQKNCVHVSHTLITEIKKHSTLNVRDFKDIPIMESIICDLSTTFKALHSHQ